MLIAIDYDGTYTADPKLWRRFIIDATKAGHEVICATMRTEVEVLSMCEDLKNLTTIIYTNRKAKKIALLEQNIKPDIWIDDNPFWILNDG